MAAESPAIGIRAARAADASSICRIYNQGIEDRVATLETEMRTPRERARWLASRGPRHPVIVAERDGDLLGWGSLNPFNPRPAYDHVADFSVYVERAARGQGIGRRLIETLVERAVALRFHKLVLSAFPWNHGGIALYTRLGFRTVGTYREQGWLDGAWVDTVIMERILDCGSRSSSGS